MFPRSALAQYLAGTMYRKQGQAERSSQLFNEAHRNSAEFLQLQLFVESEIGYNHFLLLEWQAARERLEHFLAATTSQGFKAFIGWQLGCCYAMLGRDADAKAAMTALLPWVRKDYDYDEFSGRRARLYIRSGMSEVEKALVIATLHFEHTLFDEAIKVVDQALSGNTTEEDKGCLYRQKAQCLQSKGQHDEAIQLYNAAVATEKALQKENIYVIPHSLVGLAEIYVKQGKKDLAKAAIKKARTYSGYDWEQLNVMKLKKAAQAAEA
eukprot:TRINITY_DN1666_c0_g1_i2.p2 TRINITY_DN1666_c0_g1~~TRINITY_DN1666_c0_g1_i2.p2  ORF type:complete len:267 (-),score=59.74 TRINITY_DN1666_c0_g1_i2:10-810(-)